MDKKRLDKIMDKLDKLQYEEIPNPKKQKIQREEPKITTSKKKSLPNKPIKAEIEPQIEEIREEPYIPLPQSEKSKDEGFYNQIPDKIKIPILKEMKDADIYSDILLMVGELKLRLENRRGDMTIHPPMNHLKRYDWILYVVVILAIMLNSIIILIKF